MAQFELHRWPLVRWPNQQCQSTEGGRIF